MSSNPERKERGLEEQKIAERLREATRLIYKQKEHSGLSENFQEEVIKANEAAVAMCERAMEDLSTNYVESLADFKDSSEALRALSHLEKSEEIWKKGAEVIESYDREGGEALFLKKMRAVAADVLEKKLLATETQGGAENDALCLGIMGVLDGMLNDLGFPLESQERIFLKEKVKRFQ